ELIGLPLLQDRFVMISYPFFAIFSSIGIVFSVKYLTSVSVPIIKMDGHLKQLILYGIVITIFATRFLPRAINYNFYNLGTSMDSSLYNAIRFTGEETRNNNDVVIANNLYRYWMLAYYPNINLSYAEYYLI